MTDAKPADTPTSNTTGKARSDTEGPAQKRSARNGPPTDASVPAAAAPSATRIDRILDSILTKEEQEQIRETNRRRHGEVCISCLDPCHCVPGGRPGASLFACTSERPSGDLCGCPACDCLSSRRAKGLNVETDTEGWVPGAQGTAPGFRNSKPRTP